MNAPATPVEPVPDTRRRVHLVYPHGNRKFPPDAIGRQLGRRLEARYRVVYHDWTDRGSVEPEPGDVLIGHPHPSRDTVFRRSLRQAGWHRRLMLAPFHHGDLKQIAFEDGLVGSCDLILAITGPYWYETVGSSACAHWLPKMVHLDMAIDRNDFPPLKANFNEPGKRRVVYIGHSGRGKNTAYLSEISSHLRDVDFGWVGKGEKQIEGFERFGFVDFGSPFGRDLLARYDFLLTVGDADANPTTILEAMAWGLVPICTPTSGYAGISGITNVPLSDAAEAAGIVRRLLDADESELLAVQAENWRRLDDHYTWDRFTAQVCDAIESKDSPVLGPRSLERHVEFALYDVISPYGRLADSRPGRLASRLHRRWKWLRINRTY